MLLDLLDKAGNLFDLPGSMVRDALTLNNPLDQLLSPLSSENRMDGRDVLEKWGMLGPNTEGLDVGDVAGTAAGIALDPLTWVSGAGVMKLLGRGSKAAKAGTGTKAAQALLEAPTQSRALVPYRSPSSSLQSVLQGPTSPMTPVDADPFAVMREAMGQRKPAALPAPAPVFYSRLRRAIEQLPDNPKGYKSQSVLNMLKKAPEGISMDEFNYSGLPEQLAHTPVQSKAMLLDVLDEGDVAAHTQKFSPSFSPRAKLDPVTRSLLDDLSRFNYTNPTPADALRKTFLNWHHPQMIDALNAIKPGLGDGVANGGASWGDLWDAYHPSNAKTRYSEFAMPTGKDYTETLLTEPIGVGTSVEARRAYELEKKLSDGIDSNSSGGNTLTRSEWDELIALRDAFGYDINKGAFEQAADRMNMYHSPHWEQPNVTAHLRTTRRNLDGVGEVPFIDEIQSDWHQAGRSQGYGITKDPPVDTSGWTATEDVSQQGELVWRIKDASGNRIRSVWYADAKSPEAALKIATDEAKSVAPKVTGVPDSPFKNQWQDLALKQALYDAAASGSPGISWTTGQDIAAIVGGKTSGQLKFYDEEIPARIRKLLGTKGQKDVQKKFLTIADLKDPKNQKEIDDFLIEPEQWDGGWDPGDGADDPGDFPGGFAPQPIDGPTGFAHYIPIDPNTRARILAEGFPLLSLPFLAAFGLTGGEQRGVQ